MKYTIRQDEVWPEYTPITPAVESYGEVYGVEIPEQFMDRYRRAANEWNAVQAVLETRYREQEDAYMPRRRRVADGTE